MSDDLLKAKSITFAESIRKFFDALFPNRTVLFLRRQSQERESIICAAYNQQIERLEDDLAEARKERDYFRGRAERLELRLIPEQAPPKKREAVQEIPGRPLTWNQVQQEHARKNREIDEKEAREKQQKESRIDAPKPLDAESKSTEAEATASPIDSGASAPGREESA